MGSNNVCLFQAASLIHGYVSMDSDAIGSVSSFWSNNDQNPLSFLKLIWKSYCLNTTGQAL